MRPRADNVRPYTKEGADGRRIPWKPPHPSPPAAAPPSPARGEGLSVRLPRLLCSHASASVGAFPHNGEVNCGTRPPGRVISHRLLFTSKAFPLTGEGGWPQARRMRVKKPKASPSFTNSNALYKVPFQICVTKSRFVKPRVKISKAGNPLLMDDCPINCNLLNCNS